MMGFTSKYRQGIVTTCKGNICELTKKLILFSLPLRMKMYSYMSYYDKLEVSQTDTQPQIYIYALESAKSCLSCNYCQLIVAFTIYKIYVVRKEERKHHLEHKAPSPWCCMLPQHTSIEKAIIADKFIENRWKAIYIYR